MDLKAGTRMRSTTDSTEVIIVKSPSQAVDLRCGGQPMVSIEDARGPDLPIEPGFDGGCQLGKRYADDDSGIEVLCTKPGPASLTLGTEALHLKGAKPLPSSD